MTPPPKAISKEELKLYADRFTPRCLLGRPVDLVRTREVLKNRRELFTLHAACGRNVGGKILALFNDLSPAERDEPWALVACSYFEEEVWLAQR